MVSSQSRSHTILTVALKASSPFLEYRCSLHVLPSVPHFPQVLLQGFFGHRSSLPFLLSTLPFFPISSWLYVTRIDISQGSGYPEPSNNLKEAIQGLRDGVLPRGAEGVPALTTMQLHMLLQVLFKVEGLPTSWLGAAE